jgi:hypothetical protein
MATIAENTIIKDKICKLNTIAFAIWNRSTLFGLKYKRTFAEVSFRDLLNCMFPNEHNARQATAEGPNHKVMETSIFTPSKVNQTRGLFTVRSHGIVIYAESIKQLAGSYIEICFGPDGTIADGGNTDLIIQRAIAILTGEKCLDNYSQEEIDEILDGESILIEIISNVDPSDTFNISEITESRAATLAQKQTSLANQRGQYDWLKNLLGEKADYISWAENDYLNDLDDPSVILNKKDMAQAKKKRNRVIPAFNLLKILSAASNMIDNPLDSYNKGDKQALILGTNPEAFTSMSEVAIDLFKIHDYLIANAGKWYKYKTGSSSAGEDRDSVFQPIKNKTAELEQLIFLSDSDKKVFGQKSPKILLDGFTYPVLAALRNLLVPKEVNINGENVTKYFWADGVNYDIVISWLEDGLGNLIMSNFVTQARIFGWSPNPTIKKGTCWAKASELVVIRYAQKQKSLNSFEDSLRSDPVKLKAAAKIVREMNIN